MPIVSIAIVNARRGAGANDVPVRRSNRVGGDCVQRGGCQYNDRCVTINVCTIASRRRHEHNGGRGRDSQNRGRQGGRTDLHHGRHGTVTGFNQSNFFLAKACRRLCLPRSFTTYEQSIRGCGQQIVNTAMGHFNIDQSGVQLVL